MDCHTATVKSLLDGLGRLGEDDVQHQLLVYRQPINLKRRREAVWRKLHGNVLVREVGDNGLEWDRSSQFDPYSDCLDASLIFQVQLDGAKRENCVVSEGGQRIG